jgi:dihydrofolate reductase
MRVVLIMTTTADGFISKDPSDPAVFAHGYDELLFSEKTLEIGTVVMGLNAYRLLPHPFDGRLNIVMSTSPNVAEGIPGTLEFFSGSPQELIDSLEKRGISELAVIGGGQVNASFLVEGLVDEIYLMIAPYLFGQGLSLASGFDLETSLKLVDERRLGENAILLHYEVVK